jgi:hypothetical protein
VLQGFREHYKPRSLKMLNKDSILICILIKMALRLQSHKKNRENLTYKKEHYEKSKIYFKNL